MKKLILAAFALTTAASVFAQGTVTFNTKNSAGTSHVWGPSTTAPGLSLVGFGSNDGPNPGTIPYAASGMALIGAGNVSGGHFGYGTTFAQLLGGPFGTAEASLQPGTPTTTFKSGASLGNVFSIGVSLPNVLPDAASATLEMVAWDNSSGLYPTWAEASIAWNNGQNGLIAAGKSGTFTVNLIGGSVNTPPNMLVPSFNLYNSVPEPSTFALAGLGAAAMLIFRRRK